MSVFDRVIDRRATISSKWEKYAGQDVIPMWVADMDFAAPQPVLQAIQERLAHPVLGYNARPLPTIDVIQHWLSSHYRWSVDAEAILLSPGVVPALNQAVRAFVRPGRAVAVAVPTYPPFLQAPLNMSRDVQRLTMTAANDWTFPIDQLKAVLSGDHNIDLLMLSHPMNPVGKVLDRPMLEEIARVCEQANVVICSDEIHCDLLLDGRRHTPLASISAEAAARTVTFQAASKTFNLAGLGCAYAVIENPTLRETFEQAGAGIMAHVNTLGFVATQAALSECESWRLELLDYLAENRDRVCEVVERLAGLSIQRPQATYLAWIDVRELALDNPHDFFADYGLGIAAGEEYEGPGYIRLNFGCPRSTLEEGLARLVRAVDSL